MLSRRFPLVSSSFSRKHLSTSTTAISFSSIRFAANNNNKGSEDADEIAREQKLREMFANKQAPQGGNGGLWDQFKQAHYQAKEFAAQKAAEAARQRAGGGAAPAGGATGGAGNTNNNQVENTTTTPSGRPPVPNWVGPSQSFWTFMVYVTAAYSLFLVWQLSDDQSFISLTQGVPHWANTPHDVAAYMIFRILFSYSDQRRIQQEFEAVAPAAPNASFLDFLNQRYGYAQLSGNTASFQETVALVAAALRQDFANNTRVIAQAANKAGRDNREKIEAIANALRTAGIRPLYSNNNSSGSNVGFYQQQQQVVAPPPPMMMAGGYAGSGYPPLSVNLAQHPQFTPLHNLPPQLLAQLQQQARSGGGVTTLSPQQAAALQIPIQQQWQQHQQQQQEKSTVEPPATPSS